jgi:hypothetical protein
MKSFLRHALVDDDGEFKSAGGLESESVHGAFEEFIGTSVSTVISHLGLEFCRCFPHIQCGEHNNGTCLTSPGKNHNQLASITRCPTLRRIIDWTVAFGGPTFFRNGGAPC